MRRSTFTDRPVSYGAIGATQAPDLLGYPPKGYRPTERSIRIGSGSERFETAGRSLMSWGIQRASGMRVTDLHEGTGEQYAGVRFNDDGSPAELQEHRESEQVFADDGTPFITNGMSATLHVRTGILSFAAPVRVVYVIDEERRVGFAYGTMAGHPVSGEEAFVLEHRDDDSVWLVIRSLSRPATWYYRLASPLVRIAQRRIATRYLRALLPARIA
ncbi:DUF1990 domain-containing protein [Microbacterium sp. STN6]|uniref:DUF1990 family protein n=1 Tax=Microbacterium sp. STN6 TaxID=2995588 RepID=UPI0022608C8B|nr:DUF1990 domain-containing protein [Microbacterium sp. STN6]MCX7522301.1 DUF1990 domain-containing protein [Microbacterium sp. STN6]